MPPRPTQSSSLRGGLRQTTANCVKRLTVFLVNFCSAAPSEFVLKLRVARERQPVADVTVELALAQGGSAMSAALFRQAIAKRRPRVKDDPAVALRRDEPGIAQGCEVV